MSNPPSNPSAFNFGEQLQNLLKKEPEKKEMNNLAPAILQSQNAQILQKNQAIKIYQTNFKNSAKKFEQDLKKEYQINFQNLYKINDSRWPKEYLLKQDLSNYKKARYWSMKKIEEQASEILPVSDKVQDYTLMISNSEIKKINSQGQHQNIWLTGDFFIIVQTHKQYLSAVSAYELNKNDVNKLKKLHSQAYEQAASKNIFTNIDDFQAYVNTILAVNSVLATEWRERPTIINEVIKGLLNPQPSIFKKQGHKQDEVRIVILNNKWKKRNQNYFIYHEDQMQKMPQDIQLFKNVLTKKKIDKMVGLLKLHNYIHTHRLYLGKIQKNLQGIIDQNIFKHFQNLKKKKIEHQAKLRQDLFKTDSLQIYQKSAAKYLLQSWLVKAKQKKTSKSLFIEISQLWLKKQLKVKQVKVSIKETTKIFELDRNDDSFSIYKYNNNKKDQQDSKCFKVDLAQKKGIKFVYISVSCVVVDKTQSLIGKPSQRELKYEDRIQFNNLTNNQQNFIQELIIPEQNEQFRQSYHNAQNYCILYIQKAISRKKMLMSTSSRILNSIFKNVGEIPTKYLNTIHIQYTPQNYVFIQELIKSSSPTTLNVQNYQMGYLKLVKFMQLEENLSQCNRNKNIRIVNGLAMKARYSTYNEVINQIEGKMLKQNNSIHKQKGADNKQKLDANKQIQIFQTYADTKFLISKKIYKNICYDLQHYNSQRKQFIKNYIVFLVHCSFKNKKIIGKPFHINYTSNLIPIANNYITLIIYNPYADLRMTTITIDQLTIQDSHLIGFAGFIALLYPYWDMQILQRDLHQLRWLVQKKMPFFNAYLNRSQIGLQNFIAPYLLCLFTQLIDQLTFRIWDYLILCEDRDKARVIIAFTLLSYFQTTKLMPIIPINEFMIKVDKNMSSIVVSNEFDAKFIKISESYYYFERNKHRRLQKLLMSDQTNMIIDERHLSSMIFGVSKMGAHSQNQGKVIVAAGKKKQQQKFISITELNYPLPRPKYFGIPITDIIIFIHNLNLLQNLNLSTHQYFIRFQLKGNAHNDKQKQKQWSSQFAIYQKNYFYNRGIVFSNIPERVNKDGVDKEREIVVSIVKKIDKKEVGQIQLAGSIFYGSYHKDKAYKVVLPLRPMKLHNKGETVINFSICLKSKSFNKPIQIKDYSNLQIFYEKALDNQIGQSNDSITSLQIFKQQLDRVKYPLDQFQKDQYKRMQNSALYFYQPDLLQSSKTSIEQLKVIFYNWFTQDKDKNIRHQISKYYQIFSQQNNLQHIYLSDMLIKFVLLADITKKKKLSYLYCICVHYQNCYTTRVTLQTVDALIRIIYKQHCFLNAFPLSNSRTGFIQQAYFYQYVVKNQDKKIDCTQIMQEWAYICAIKYGYCGIILGSARNLTILRSLFDMKTLKKIQQQNQFRFQIIYVLDGLRYLWSIGVDSKTFAIVKRGPKFLNIHDSYGDIKYLNSTNQLLLNCQNLIPLQNARTLNYKEFSSEMMGNSLINYLLEQPSIVSKQELQTVKFQAIILDKKQKQKQNIQQKDFKNWAIYRSQNCMNNWRKCQINDTQDIFNIIQYEATPSDIFKSNLKDQQLYNVSSWKVPMVDVISMQQINIEEQL